MSEEWKPEGHNSLSPYLITGDAPAVIDFLVAAFGAEPLLRHERPDGAIMHAELRVDDTIVMLGSAGDNWPPVPCHLHLYVPDVDSTYEAALAAGAETVQPPSKGDDPDRRGGVKGPGGNTWWISTRVG